MNALAFVPAKGYSARLSSKNTREVGGVPLWRRAADVGRQALGLGLVQTVAVSTDDPGIYSAARDLPDIEAWTRPNYPNIHDAEWGRKSVADVLRFHFAAARWEERSRKWDMVCVLWPTSPLRTLRHLIESRLLLEDGWDGVLSVVPFCPSVTRALVVETDGEIGRADSAKWEGEFWRHDGTALWVRSGVVLKGGDFYTGRMRAYPINPEESVDVDTDLDLILAEALWRRSTP
mgnify:CR=1 FL=1